MGFFCKFSSHWNLSIIFQDFGVSLFMKENEVIPSSTNIQSNLFAFIDTCFDWDNFLESKPFFMSNLSLRLQILKNEIQWAIHTSKRDRKRQEVREQIQTSDQPA